MNGKIENQKAWLLVLPALALVALNAIIPLMAVVNYSVQETFGNNLFFEGGSVRRGAALTAHAALAPAPSAASCWRSRSRWRGHRAGHTRRGPWVSVCLVLMALPLLIPWNVVGAMWNIFALPDVGMLGRTLKSLGLDYNYTQQPLAAWATMVAMDVWHWTSLVVLLAYAGLSAIPDAYYQAARIDGASSWAIFRYVQLPKMRRVLTIAVLLRFMDSFNIYTEVLALTGGGPGNATTLLSIDLVKIALGQFDLGPAAAMSLIYFLIILLFSWLFYTVITRGEEEAR
jgi:glycerol transport system permease protein